MSNTLFNVVRIAMLGALLAGCGLTQKVTESTASVTKAILYKQVNVLHLDFDGRAAVNTHSEEMSALSVPTVVRVYQLRDGKSFGRATYDELLVDGDHVLAADLLEQRSLVVKPGEGLKLDWPLDKSAQAIAVVGLFREPDLHTNSWRLTLNRDDLNPDRARVIEMGDNRLALRPKAKE
jgi:type VI secretion system protein VasD